MLYAVPFILVFTFCGHFFCEGDSMSLEDPMGSLRCQFFMFKEILMRRMEF